MSEEPKKNHPTSFYLDDETITVLKGLVEDLGMNRSAIVREAIKRMSGDVKMAEVRKLVRKLEKMVSGS